MSRFAVVIGTATGDAAFHFTPDALEALERRFEISDLPRRINRDMKAIRQCIRRTLINSDMTVDEVLEAVPFNKIRNSLLDAYFMAMRGQTFAEVVKEMEQANRKPLLAS